MPGHLAGSQRPLDPVCHSLARWVPVWTAATLSDSDMDWHYLCHEARSSAHTASFRGTRLGRGPPLSLPTGLLPLDHGVNSLDKYRRRTRLGHGPVPECSKPDPKGATLVALGCGARPQIPVQDF